MRVFGTGLACMGEGGGGTGWDGVFRPGVGFSISMSRTEGAGVLGHQGVPSIGPSMQTGARGVPSTGGGGSLGSSGGSWYSTSKWGGFLVFGNRGAYRHMPP